MNALLEAVRIIEAEAVSIQECATNFRTGEVDPAVKDEIQHYRTVAALLRHASETLTGERHNPSYPSDSAYVQDDMVERPASKQSR